jgi:hypothetical protein
MSCRETARIARIAMPARADVGAVTEIGGVESQAGDDGESVAGPRVNRDPFSAPAFTVTEKIARRQRRIEKAALMELVAGRSCTRLMLTPIQ